MIFKRDYSIVRQAHCQLLEMIDMGLVDPRYVLESALGWMTDDEIEKMAYINELFESADYEDEDEE
jgi:hypothetical protein